MCSSSPQDQTGWLSQGPRTVTKIFVKTLHGLTESGPHSETETLEKTIGIVMECMRFLVKGYPMRTINLATEQWIPFQELNSADFRRNLAVLTAKTSRVCNSNPSLFGKRFSKKCFYVVSVIFFKKNACCFITNDNVEYFEILAYKELIYVCHMFRESVSLSIRDSSAVHCH